MGGMRMEIHPGEAPRLGPNTGSGSIFDSVFSFDPEPLCLVMRITAVMACVRYVDVC
jgi:hypothetical protein